VRFYSVAAITLIASGVGASALAQTNGANAPPPNFTGEPIMTSLPASPKELLVNIHSALSKGALLSDSFYTPTSLKNFFGAGYRFAEAGETTGHRIIYFDDGGNVYVDEQGKLTQLGRNRPCLRRGTILFDAGDSRRRAKASISMFAIGRIGSPSTFGADLVREVFGVPNSITEGVPSVPASHGGEYVATERKDELGNRWLNYQAETDGHLQRVKFRTLDDATVIEIQLLEEQR
jgi:hypothetical protein